MNRILLLIIGFFFTSCAASYHPIMSPEKTVYTSDAESTGVYMKYKYEVLRHAGNKKLGKKEDRRGVRVLAVQVTNETNRPLELNKDIQLYSGDRLIHILPPETVRKEIHQVSGLYMLWSLFWITITKCENDDCSIIPLPVGVVIGFANMGIASNANKRFMNDLMRYNLLDKPINPGETVSGLIGIAGQTGQPLQMVVKESLD